MPPTGIVEYTADSARRNRILSLAKRENPENEIWDSFFLYGKWSFFIAGALLLLGFGPMLQAPRLLLIGGAVTAAAGLAVLLPFLLRAWLGNASCWHNFINEKVILGEETVTLAMTYATLRVKDHEPYVWVMSYRDITRVEYVSELRRVRLWGKFDEETSRKPGLRTLPKGMRPDYDKLKNTRPFLEIPLYFKESIELIEQLQARTKLYISPALGAGDYLGIDDLLGISPEPWLIKPVALALALYSLAFVSSALSIESYRDKHPFHPFLETEEAVLTRVFTTGDTVSLDGCDITIERAEFSQLPEQARLAMTIRNTNDISVLFHWSEVNLKAMTAIDPARGSFETCKLVEPSESLIQIEPGGIYETECVIGWERPTQQLIINVSSDHWYQGTGLVRRDYVGYPVKVQLDSGTITVMSNVITFNIPVH